ncbi:MAG: homoserine dehydrogenase [Gemmataceae bacterium]
MSSLGIAVLGCGTVGSGVVWLLREQADRLAKRTGRRLELRHVTVRDAKKPRKFALPDDLVSSDIDRALSDSQVDVVVELIGGTSHAKDAVLGALAAGKHVVTANKALLARHGDEIFTAARAANRAIAFEASVMGGVPVISTINVGLAANQITRLEGIVNGTCNFILTEMTERNRDYATALAEAQRLGYAEADPTLDVDGSDSADKLAILCRLAFGVSIHPDQIAKRGIQKVTTLDLNLARKEGFAIKLIAEGRLEGDKVTTCVWPSEVPQKSPLAQVRGADNALQITSDVAVRTFVSGPGAGHSTASAVVADLIDVAMGRAQLTFNALR